MKYIFNPITGHLNVSKPKDPIQGANATTYFTFDGTTVYLYVNGVVAQSWTVTPTPPTPSTGFTGQPYGLLLTLTQP